MLGGSSKKILVVTQHFYPESFRVNDLVKGFVEDGYSVDVLCGLPNYPSGEWEDGYGYFGHREDKYCGANVFRCLEIRRKNNSSLRIFLNYVSWPFFASLRALFMKKNYDAVFCYNTSPVLMVLPAIVASKRNRCRLVTYVLDIWPENLYTVLDVKSSVLRSVATKVSDALYASCDCLISLSGPLDSVLRSRLGKRGKIPSMVVAPQHCETFYENTIEDESLVDNFSRYNTLVFAGNISPAQGLETVFDALRIAIFDKGVKDLHLLVVGDGMSRNDLEEYASEIGLNNFVTFWGRVEPTEIPKFSFVAKAMVAPFSASPELELTIPAKVASCMASAKPLLGVMNGAGADVIAEAGCGLVSKPGDSKALADNIVKLCGMTDMQRRDMGNKGFAYYEEHFSRRTALDVLESTLAS